ncbi:MAG: hypothetical protein EVA89_09195 [Sandaracinaceae bacterium]|nr:MAG: hypothetical protein EVA89_09195 [Sandaracinaceae bacterium]
MDSALRLFPAPVLESCSALRAQLITGIENAPSAERNRCRSHFRARSQSPVDNRNRLNVTTSRFSRDAREFASSASDGIVLVNGRQLADLMIDFCVGWSTMADRL